MLVAAMIDYEVRMAMALILRKTAIIEVCKMDGVWKIKLTRRLGCTLPASKKPRNWRIAWWPTSIM